MRLSYFTGVLLLAVAAPISSVIARADDFNTLDVESAQLIAQQVALQMRQDMDIPVTEASYSGGSGCGDWMDDPSCYPCGWDVGAELAILKTHHTRDPQTLNSQQPEYNYAAGVRTWLGYMGDHGIGVRGRYFYFHDTSETLVDGGDFLHFGVQMHITDLEMTFRATKEDWCLLTFAGVRYMQLEGEIVDQGGVDLGHFWGYGPTVGVESRRRYLCGLTPFANVRASLLMGEYDHRGDSEPAINTYYEAQLGLEWTRQVSGRELFVRGAFETQYSPLLGTTYESGSDNEEDNMEFGLVGASLAAGLRF